MKIPPGKVLADRYRFISVVPSRSGAATAWRATDLVFEEEVVVYFLSSDLPPAPEQSAAFQDAFVRASRIPHSTTVRWHTLDLESGLAVREWVNGFTLHELLRRRREISVSETLLLLSRLPETLDAIASSGITLPGDLLREAWVAFEPGSPATHLPARGPSEWPRHHTKLTVMRLRDFWQKEEGDMALATALPSTGSNPIWVRLARVICELLGGRIREGGWIPLPALNEKANQLLHETIGGKKWNSACHFWGAFEANAVESKSRIEAIQPARKPLAFSVASGPGPSPCRVAALIPRDKSCAPIHLCAGTEFNFGRSSSLAEFPTILLPATPESEKMTGEIGRIQARLEARDGALWLRDGNGEAASRNGTQWNGGALPGNFPVPFLGRGVLNLANQYKVTLIPILAETTPAIPGSMKGEPALPAHWCAVIPTPVGGVEFVRRSVWILKTLEFDLDKDGNIRWRRGDYFEPLAVFVRMNEGFYLGKLALSSESFQVDDVEIPRGQAIPMIHGQSIQIGPNIYRVSTAA